MDKSYVVLSDSDIKCGIIRLSKIRSIIGENTDGKITVECNGEKIVANIPKAKKYIDRLGEFHKQNNAHKGTKVLIEKTGEGQFKLAYQDSTETVSKTGDDNIKTDELNIPNHKCGIINCDTNIPKTTELEDDIPVKEGEEISAIQKAFVYLGDSYRDMLCEKGIALTRDDIGFTERNLTFYFCSGYKSSKDDAIVWQELPIFDSHQHLDSIIIDKDNDAIDVYYVEAKRIYNKNYVVNNGGSHGSLTEDYDRLKSNFESLKSKEQFIKKIPGLYYFLKKSPKENHHIVLIASLEYKSREREDTFRERVKAIEDFANGKKEMRMLHYNVRDGFGKPVSKSKDKCLYKLEDEQRRELLSFVNLDLYLMIEDV